MGLKEQSTIVSSIVSSSFTKEITNWQNVLKRLPVNIHNFARRYLIFNLANNSNLFRWKIFPSSNCNLCLKPQTQLHIFNFSARALDPFTWRHNSIVSSLCNHLNKKICRDFKIFADLTNYENPGNLFKSKRPDIVIKESDSITAIELTCPFELNIIKSREYKENKYRELKNDLVAPYKQFTLILLELTSLGFVSKNIKEMRTLLQKLNIDDHYVINKLTKVVIRCSYMIYCKRNKDWPNPELLCYE